MQERGTDLDALRKSWKVCINESHAVIEYIEVEWPSDAELDLHAGCG